MFPTKLQKGESYSVLLERYNQLVDYLRETRLVSGSGIRINKRAAGITIESLAKASGGGQSAPAADEYNGFFKIVDISTENDRRIMVVDGATWDSSTLISGLSFCSIDGGVFSVSPWTSPTIAGHYNVFLQYHYDGTNHTFKIRMFPASQNIPPNRMTIKFYHIGEVYVQDGLLKIIQRHTSGMIQFTGGITYYDFSLIPIFTEPPDSGTITDQNYSIHVNGGTVHIGLNSVFVAQQNFTSLSPSENHYIYLTVTFSEESRRYSATIGCYTTPPTAEQNSYVAQVGYGYRSDYFPNISQTTYNLDVTGVWV